MDTFARTSLPVRSVLLESYTGICVQFPLQKVIDSKSRFSITFFFMLFFIEKVLRVKSGVQV